MLDLLKKENPSKVYTITEIIGEGAYGVIYRAFHIPSDSLVAVKIVSLSHEDDINSPNWLLPEDVKGSMNFRSPHVNELKECYLYNRELWIIMEYAAGGSFGQLKSSLNRPFSEEEVQCIVAFCLLALSDIHQNKIIHRDIKPDNILLYPTGCVKVTDFGISTQLENTLAKRRTVIGTPYYMAPEMIEESAYNFSVDVWGMGITAIELLEGKPPHHQLNSVQAILAISTQPAPSLWQPNKFSSAASEFLSRCLRKSPLERATPRELLTHPWIVAAVSEICEHGNAACIERLFLESVETRRLASGNHGASSFRPIAVDAESCSAHSDREESIATRLSLTLNSNATRAQVREATINLARSLNYRGGFASASSSSSSMKGESKGSERGRRHSSPKALPVIDENLSKSIDNGFDRDEFDRRSIERRSHSGGGIRRRSSKDISDDDNIIDHRHEAQEKDHKSASPTPQLVDADALRIESLLRDLEEQYESDRAALLDAYNMRRHQLRQWLAAAEHHESLHPTSQRK